MRIAITDSGVGGLSVCAAVERDLRHDPVTEDIDLLYLNAALEDDYSYNAMPSRSLKVRTFDRFLDSIAARYEPDLLYIACNSLSVLFPDTRFFLSGRLPVLGIAETGKEQLLAEWQRHPESDFLVLATPTTVAEGVYGACLRAAGLTSGRIVEQACPGLADAISNDASGRQARALLENFVPAALERFERPPSRLAVFLGCTHYGYQAGLFEELLRARAPRFSLLNPNQAASGVIREWIGSPAGRGSLSVRFISRYAIPARPIASLSAYLDDAAPATLDALRDFEQVPDLYGHEPLGLDEP